MECKNVHPQQNCHQHHGVCCFRCCRTEQFIPGTTNAVLLSTTFCAKTKETAVYQLLRAHLRIFFISCYTNVLFIFIFLPMIIFCPLLLLFCCLPIIIFFSSLAQSRRLKIVLQRRLIGVKSVEEGDRISPLEGYIIIISLLFFALGSINTEGCKLS